MNTEMNENRGDMLNLGRMATCCALYLIAVLTLAGPVHAGDDFPVDNAFPPPQFEPDPNMHSHPKSPMPYDHYPSMNPQLTPHINEPHPFPDYLKQYPQCKNIPEYYRKLTLLEPVNQVQSRVFNPELFRKAQRIGVDDFQNKIPDRFRDENAGKFLSSQISTELESVRRLFVIPPSLLDKSVHIQMQTVPETERTMPPKPSENKENQTPSPSGYELPFPSDKMDAVMIGAVTQYSSRYVDRSGKSAESLPAAVEFGAFLIDPKSCEVIWGARFVGTQRPTLTNLLEGKYYWMSRQELSQQAMKKVLKDFKETSRRVR